MSKQKENFTECPKNGPMKLGDKCESSDKPKIQQPPPAPPAQNSTPKK